MKKITLLFLTALSLKTFKATAQAEPVIYQDLNLKNLRVRPGVSIYIPYVKLKETSITGDIYVEGAYQLQKRADVSATLHLGSFKGIRLGGTLHLKDKMATRNTKFKIATSVRGNKETTTFYRLPSQFRIVNGPTANIRVGAFSNSGLYMRLEGGLDHQVYSRAHYRGYASNRNGYTSIKLLGTVAKFRQAEITENATEDYVDRLGIGALVSLFHERKPWKRLSYHIGLDMGYMHVLGAKAVSTKYVTFEVNKANYILELKGGVSISL